jgi:hypothetical protein
MANAFISSHNPVVISALRTWATDILDPGGI